jgi:hypothetical protein
MVSRLGTDVSLTYIVVRADDVLGLGFCELFVWLLRILILRRSRRAVTVVKLYVSFNPSTFGQLIFLL